MEQAKRKQLEAKKGAKGVRPRLFRSHLYESSHRLTDKPKPSFFTRQHVSSCGAIPCHFSAKPCVSTLGDLMCS